MPASLAEIARSVRTREAYQSEVERSCREHTADGFDERQWSGFAARLHYLAVDVARPASLAALTQLLCIIAMEPPAISHADAMRDEKLKVLRALRPIAGAEVLAKTVRGQYKAGASAGKPARGYLEEEGVPSGSTTEIFVAIKAEIDTWRWAGVPLYLRTGKRLQEKLSEIVITFEDVPHTIFGPDAIGSNLADQPRWVRMERRGVMWSRFTDAAQAAAALAGQVAAALRHGLDVRGAASLVVPGGRTPLRFFRVLREAVLDWSPVTPSLSCCCMRESPPTVTACRFALCWPRAVRSSRCSGRPEAGYTRTRCAVLDGASCRAGAGPGGEHEAIVHRAGSTRGADRSCDHRERRCPGAAGRLRAQP